jgi:hypothetical protein
MTLEKIIHHLIDPANQLRYANHGDRKPKFDCIDSGYQQYGEPDTVQIGDVVLTFYEKYQSDPRVSFIVDQVHVGTYRVNAPQVVYGGICRGSMEWKMHSAALETHVTQAVQTLYDRCLATKHRQDQEERARVNREQMERDAKAAALMNRFGIPIPEIEPTKPGQEETPLQALDRRMKDFKPTAC